MDDSAPPPVLAGYHVLTPLGRGGGSIIYLAEDKKTQEQFAVKHVVLRDRSDARFREQVENEWKVGSKVSHPALRRCYKIKRKWGLFGPGEIIMLMELADGMNMSEKGAPSLVQALRIFTRVAEGLRALHQSGFVHADVNLNNILVGDGMKIKIIDYGQSCPIGSVKKRVQGTLSFIAPEQVQKRPLDHRTDIFNFGASLYLAVTGTTLPPIALKDGPDRRTGERRIVAPIERKPELPETLSDLIVSCIQPSPADRPNSIDEVLAELHAEIRELI